MPIPDQVSVDLTTSTLFQISQSLKPEIIDRWINIASGLIGAIIGGAFTLLATNKTLRAAVKAQREEFKFERNVRVRSVWKGFYFELQEIKKFLGNPFAEPSLIPDSLRCIVS